MAEYQSLIHVNGEDTRALQHLRRLLNIAIHQVSTEIAMGGQIAVITKGIKEGNLPWTMRCIRAAEIRHLSVIQRAITAYLRLATLALDPLSPSLLTSGGLNRMRDRAVTFAREDALEQLQHFHRDIPVLT